MSVYFPADDTATVKAANRRRAEAATLDPDKLIDFNAAATRRASPPRLDPGVLFPRPTEVVDLRSTLLDFWRRTPMRYPTLQIRMTRWDIEHHPKEPETVRHGLEQMAGEADLYWVHPDMVTVLEAVAPSMPPVNPDPPCPFGLVVMARPIVGIDAGDGGVIETSAYGWAPSFTDDGARLPGDIHPDPGRRRIPTWTIFTFGDRAAMRATFDVANAEFGIRQDKIDRMFTEAHSGGKLIYTGMSSWPRDSLSGVTDFLYEEDEAARIASVLEDRRLLAAFWALQGQRLAETTLEAPDRHTAKRAVRAKAPQAPVRVIRLRQASKPSEPGAEHHPVAWSHRWFVDAYWRKTWYPKEGIHRAQLVAGHVKGPEGLPLVVRPTVRALER